MEKFAGLVSVIIELTSRCNKNCWMCGGRKLEREKSELAVERGDMEFSLLKKIARQLPKGIVVEFHRDGEPMVYPRFGEAIELFRNQVTTMITNGKLLVEKADEIIGKMDIVSVSIFEKDSEATEQLEIIKKFLEMRGIQKPLMTFRIIGDVNLAPYEELGCLVARRGLRSPLGRSGYRNPPPIPDMGICRDFLCSICVNREGKVSICAKFDPTGLCFIGDANMEKLADIWNGPKRLGWKKLHIEGKRKEVSPCSQCEYWGVPTSS